MCFPITPQDRGARDCTVASELMPTGLLPFDVKPPTHWLVIRG